MIPVPGEYSREAAEIATLCGTFRALSTKESLGVSLAKEILRYSMYDLQVIGGELNEEIFRLPRPYRDHVKQFLRDQLFIPYHLFLSAYRTGGPLGTSTPFRDPDMVCSYWDMVPAGCFTWDEKTVHTFRRWNPRHRLFYYLIAAVSMFILDQPGHPVGMPFPGGKKVEMRNGRYLCPIRDKEKDVFFSICNFCPAEQSPEEE